jgi:hypothetical protein
MDGEEYIPIKPDRECDDGVGQGPHFLRESSLPVVQREQKGDCQTPEENRYKNIRVSYVRGNNHGGDLLGGRTVECYEGNVTYTMEMVSTAVMAGGAKILDETNFLFLFVYIEGILQDFRTSLTLPGGISC